MRKSKLIYMSSALFIALGLASCGGGNDDNSKGATTSEAVEIEYSYQVKAYSKDQVFSGIKVRLCLSNGQCMMPVITGEDGIAKFEAKTVTLNDYSVHLLNLPDGYTYNPNGNTLSSTKTSLDIELFKLSTLDAGEGTSENPYVLSEGYFNNTFNAEGDIVYYTFTPATSGTYEVESYADVEGIDLMDPEFMDVTSEKAIYNHDDGYDNNFKYTLNVSDTDVNKTYKFALYLKEKTTAYPATFSFSVKKI